MPGNIIANTPAAVRAVVHSQMLMESLEDGYLPEGLHRDVTDFGDGDTLQIPTIGEMSLFDLVEGQPTPTGAISTGNIGLSITEHKGVAGSISDKLKEDGYKAAAVESAIVPSALRSLKQAFETNLLAQAVSTVNGIITLSDPNTIAGVDHRWIANGTNNTITIEDFIQAKLAMDKANVPEEGRVAIVDPMCEAACNAIANLVNASNNPQFEGIVNTGFSKGRKFIRNIYGFDIWVSNRLPRIASESITAGTGSVGAATITDGVNNVFMCLADDQCKPFMGATRRMPRVEGYRNVSERQDEFHITSRWGMAPQRGETLVSIITSANYWK
jgi:hypothetical protein